MKGVTVFPLMLVLITACAGTRKDSAISINGDLIESARSRDSCIVLFGNRVSAALDGVQLVGQGDRLGRQILVQLPAVERALIERVAGRRPSESDLEQLIELREEFTRANICGTRQPEFDLDIFSSQLDKYLFDRGIDAQVAFPSGDGTANARMLGLISLLRSANGNQ